MAPTLVTAGEQVDHSVSNLSVIHVKPSLAVFAEAPLLCLDWLKAFIDRSQDLGMIFILQRIRFPSVMLRYMLASSLTAGPDELLAAAPLALALAYPICRAGTPS